jgi:hypothetical protein
VGFDAVHFQLQTLLQQHAATLTAEDGFLAVADEAAIAGGAAPDSARVVTALYLAELAVRYLTLVESPHGQPLERRARWVLPYLETVTARL